jgi:hypothetical protein
MMDSDAVARLSNAEGIHRKVLMAARVARLRSCRVAELRGMPGLVPSKVKAVFVRGATVRNSSSGNALKNCVGWNARCSCVRDWQSGRQMCDTS